jgi:1-acyl-sn-glycerol-3-phosphate acyltransferase
MSFELPHMNRLKSLIFNIALFLATGLILTVGATSFFFSRLAVLKVTHVWSKSILWLLKKIVGLDFKVTGLERLTFPCIIACKHQSAWETIVYHAILSDPAYVLKKELDRLTFGGYIRHLQMIVVDRKGGRKALASMLNQAKAVAASGRPIIIFPEGTRSKVTEKGTYQKGIGLLYKTLQIPVYPAALNSGCFWGRRAFDKKPGTIALDILDPLKPGMEVDAFMATLEEKIEERSRFLASSLVQMS